MSSSSLCCRNRRGQSSSYRQAALAVKFANWIDLLALIRQQVGLDIQGKLIEPSLTTMNLVNELIRQLDETNEVYTGLNDVDISAALANQFGLIMHLHHHCRPLHIMVKNTCSETSDPPSSSDATTFTSLGSFISVPGLYGIENQQAIHLFLCCLTEHFKELHHFLLQPC